MKTIKFLFATACITLAISACKKDTRNNTSIVGFWRGKLGHGTDNPTIDFAVMFKEKGVCRFYYFNGVNTDTTSTSYKDDATYTIDNKTVVTTVGNNNHVLSHTGLIQNNSNVEGSFTHTSISNGNIFDNGTFFLNKQ